MYVLKKMIAGLTGVTIGSPFSKQRYEDTSRWLFKLFVKFRKERAIAIESYVEDPEESPIFSRYPGFVGDRSADRLRKSDTKWLLRKE